jgi:hypothetical protein
MEAVKTLCHWREQIGLDYARSDAMSATSQLDFEFLPLRAKLLDLAATFDRLDRGSEPLDDDPRMAKIRRALEILVQQDSDRAEQIQLMMSRAYDEDWSKKFGLTL